MSIEKRLERLEKNIADFEWLLFGIPKSLEGNEQLREKLRDDYPGSWISFEYRDCSEPYLAKKWSREDIFAAIEEADSKFIPFF